MWSSQSPQRTARLQSLSSSPRPAVVRQPRSQRAASYLRPVFLRSQRRESAAKETTTTTTTTTAAADLRVWFSSFWRGRVSRTTKQTCPCFLLLSPFTSSLSLGLRSPRRRCHDNAPHSRRLWLTFSFFLPFTLHPFLFFFKRLIFRLICVLSAVYRRPVKSKSAVMN